MGAANFSISPKITPHSSGLWLLRCGVSPLRLLAYCLMPNHWHRVLWPKKDGEMTEFLRWLLLTHSQRSHAHRHTTGYGHIYQGRFKSFSVEQDQAALNVTRYVGRNASRANLVDKAQAWRWCSQWRRVHGDREHRGARLLIVKSCAPFNLFNRLNTRWGTFTFWESRNVGGQPTGSDFLFLRILPIV
jgi:REP element-mobilizing transposase RayT